MFSFFKNKRNLSVKQKIEKKIDLIHKSNPQPSDILYLCIFGSVMSFYRSLDDDDLPSGYSSDGCIFELSSYLMFRADVYLFTNFPEDRQVTVEAMHEYAVTEFSSLGKSKEELYDLLDDRMAYYAILVQEGTDSMKTHSYLLRAIHDTAKNSGIPRDEVDNRFEPASALDEFQIRMLIPRWEAQSIKKISTFFDKLYQ
jgi:hypothetical protein